MKALRFIFDSVVNTLFTSADPALFGSRKRIREKAKLAGEFKAQAADTQSEIDALKTRNPFESASSKSALAASSRNAKQIAQRYSNILGGQANPESIIAAQGATQQAVAGTAGDIAVGSEALKANEIAGLRGQKSQQLGQYGQAKQSSIDEIGSGWNSFFNQVLPAAGKILTGAGNIAGASGQG